MTLYRALDVFEKSWYNTFRSFPFEDTEIVTYDEDDNQVIDTNELRKEIDLLLTYTIEQMQEAIEDGDMDRAECFKCWNLKTRDLSKLI